MRLKGVIALIGLIAFAGGLALAADADHSVSDRIEMLDWSDPERAALVLDGASVTKLQSADVQFLEVCGMVYADLRRDADLKRVVDTLKDLAQHNDRLASFAEHYVQAYVMFKDGHYALAGTELNRANVAVITTDSERYRFSILKGNILYMLGQAEVALPFLEKSLDLAHDMGDKPRSVQAMLWLAQIYINTDNLEHASKELETASSLAATIGDEVALAAAEIANSDIADRRGDHVAERRASIAALEHAKRSGSNKWLAGALSNLGDSYLKVREFSESLKYTKQALALLVQWRGSSREQIARFNEGIAYIGLGNIKAGEKITEDVVTEALKSENLVDAKGYLQEYAETLEKSGYLMMAIQVYHRYDKVSEKYMDIARQRAFVEVSAKFDDERRSRELELLRRDNALNASVLNAQRLRQQLIIAAALFIACICGALLWAFTRVKKANDLLRFNGERDPLTGLHNRRYFNEQVLNIDGARPINGCVLLADLDHFKRINDTYGHPAGDAVLATLSRRLAAALRESDKLVRWGGEEFLAVLDSITPEQANTTVERLLHAVRRDPIIWNGEAIHCTISIGYACFPMALASTDISLSSAISLVDKALYEAKRRGRDRACLIGSIRALDENGLAAISTEFNAAAADHRVALVDICAAA